jgi:hypothetical protein
MEKRVIRQLEINKLAVEANFSTSLAISLVRETIVKCAKCVLLPVQGPDIEFSDPVTGRVFPILWETRTFINFGRLRQHPNNGNPICRCRPRDRIPNNLGDGYADSPGNGNQHEREQPHEPVIPDPRGRIYRSSRRDWPRQWRQKSFSTTMPKQ